MATNQLDSLIDNFDNLNLVSGIITLSQKNKPQLVINGYFFRINYEGSKVTWRCIEQYCKAKCSTSGCEIGKEYNVNYNCSEHHHGPNIASLAIKEKRRKIKEITAAIAKCVSNVAPRQILTNFANEIKQTESIAVMPSYNADRQVINRIKKKIRPEYPPEPKSLADIDLPDFLKVTLEGEDDLTREFLIFDSGKDDPDRFFVFGTEQSLILMNGANLFADGTFKIAPKNFTQVYTIHTLFHGRCIPCIYCILPRKNEAIYLRVLNIIKSKLKTMPLSFTTDFERAFINAVAKVFPTSKIHGCFFHYKQAVYRKIQERLSVQYLTCAKTRHVLKLAQVIAFIPPSHVKTKFKEIKASVSTSLEFYVDLLDFFTYLEETWVGYDQIKEIGRGKNKRSVVVHKDPLFNIDLWNLNSRIHECLPRTNNFVEAWHNAFSNMLTKHPLVYSLIDTFRHEQKKNEDLIIQLKSGIVYKRPPKYIVLDNRIQEIMKDYSLENFDNFYESLSNILDY